MDAKLFVYVAHKDGKADDSALELANAARTMFPGSAPVALVAGSLVPYIRAKAESLGLRASVGLAPREARLALLVIGVAAWSATGNLLCFAATVTVVAFLSTITAIQRIAHVVRSLNT